MPRQITDHGTPDRFVTGTVGMPGERTFYLQSRSGADIVSVVLEKQQVSLLSEKMAEMLDEIGRSDPTVAAAEPGAEDLDPLAMPITEAFRVGAFGMGWDTGTHRVVLEIHAVDDEHEDVPDIGDDDSEGPDCLRVWLPPAEARAFIRRSTAVVSAGRPPCPFCHLPLDPEGHICPRANGYRR